MNNRVIQYLVAVILSIGLSVFAHAADDKMPKTDVKETKDSTGQVHSFEDLLVQGQYHFSAETVTTVEEDKVLDTLLGIRTDFKDRMESSAGRH